jgi:hypothetical protein
MRREGGNGERMEINRDEGGGWGWRAMGVRYRGGDSYEIENRKRWGERGAREMGDGEGGVESWEIESEGEVGRREIRDMEVWVGGGCGEIRD